MPSTRAKTPPPHLYEFLTRFLHKNLPVKKGGG